MEQVLYSLPDRWEWKTLGDVCLKVTDGSHNPPKGVEVGLPMLSSRNVMDNGLIWDNFRLIPEDAFENEHKRTRISEGDVLLTIVGTIGRSCVVRSLDRLFTLQRSVAVLSTEELIPEFLSYQFKAPFIQEHFISNAKGSAQKGIYLKQLKATNLVCPPIEEQKRIVEKLDALLTRIDTAIEHLQESLALADALYASTINEQMMKAISFSGLSTVENHIDQIKTGTTPPTKQLDFYENGEINWFTPSDFGDHDILSGSNKKLSQKAFDAGKARIFYAGTIMLVAIGATIGKVGYLEHDASSNQQITGMKFNSDIIPRYAYYWLRFIKPEILANASTATLPIINQKGIKALSFCAPNKQLQETICKKIDEVSNFRNTVKAELNEKVGLMRSLKASILDSAFKGEL